MSSPSLRSLPLAFGLALAWAVLVPGPARALTVRWNAPPTCADETAVRARIAETLGSRGADPSIAVEAEVTSDGTEWLLTVRLTAPEPTEARTLRAASCDPLLEGVAVIVAALLPREVAEAAPAPRSLRVDGSLTVLGEHGALPAPTASFGAGVGLIVNRLRVGLAADVLLPREAATRNVDGAEPRVGLWTVSLDTCIDLGDTRVALSPCVAIEAGQLRAREEGLKGGRSGAAPWLAPGASLALRIEVADGWTLAPEIAGFFPLRRAQIDIGPSGSEVLVHEPSRVSLRAGVSLSMRLWSGP